LLRNGKIPMSDVLLKQVKMLLLDRLHMLAAVRGFGVKNFTRRLNCCQRCGAEFMTGTGTERRRTAKWCTNRCKVAAYAERHSTKDA
jgi:hypothetical protein